MAFIACLLSPYKVEKKKREQGVRVEGVGKQVPFRSKAGETKDFQPP
jgi:hypothetical protein